MKTRLNDYNRTQNLTVNIDQHSRPKLVPIQGRKRRKKQKRKTKKFNNRQSDTAVPNQASDKKSSGDIFQPHISDKSKVTVDVELSK